MSKNDKFSFKVLLVNKLGKTEHKTSLVFQFNSMTFTDYNKYKDFTAIFWRYYQHCFVLFANWWEVQLFFVMLNFDLMLNFDVFMKCLKK